MKNFTCTEDFTVEEYQEIFRRARIFEEGIESGKNFVHLCPGRIVATMFMQESTRTSASVKTAMIRLGGGYFGFDGIKGTYLESGEEDLEDTLKGVAPLCDIMAIRHGSLDLSAFAEKGFSVPLINAMCGGDEHTIGAAAYAYGVIKHFGDPKGLKIGIYGMSKSSRPMKAAAKLLSRFGAEFIEDSVIPEFKLPDHIRKVVEENSSYKEDKLENFIGEVDYLFVVEGLPQAGEDKILLDKFNEKFVPITNEHLKLLKPTAMLEVGEPRATTDGRLVALKETDGDPRQSGKKLIKEIVYINMAIITLLLNVNVE